VKTLHSSGDTELAIELKALEMLQMRVIAESAHLHQGQADPKSSMFEIRGSELQQATSQLLDDVAGYEAWSWISSLYRV
jgi:hypothetical protein